MTQKIGSAIFIGLFICLALVLIRQVKAENRCDIEIAIQTANGAKVAVGSINNQVVLMATWPNGNGGVFTCVENWSSRAVPAEQWSIVLAALPKHLHPK